MLKAIHMLKCFTGPAIKGSGIKLNLLATPSLSDLIGNGEHSDPCQRKPDKLMGKSDPLIKQNQLKKKKKKVHSLPNNLLFFFRVKPLNTGSLTIAFCYPSFLAVYTWTDMLVIVNPFLNLHSSLRACHLSDLPFFFSPVCFVSSILFCSAPVLHAFSIFLLS